MAEQETIRYEAHPSMFRSHPFWFILCIISVIGLIPLLVWYLQTLSTKITVTDDQTTLRRGLLSKETSDVFHDNVRNIQVRQTFFQRLMGVGYIGISSAGQSGIEIEINGIRDPDRVKQIIDDCRDGRYDGE